MTPETDTAQLAAARWYGLHAGEHLARDCELMVDRCARHLTDTCGISLREALWAAEGAYVDGLHHAPLGYIDLEQSTANRLILRDYARPVARHLITLPELFQLVAARKAAHATAG